MTQVAPRRHDVQRRWEPLYGPIQAELDQVEAILRQELRSDDPFVDRLARHGFRLGGKRLRPALLLLAGKACGRITRDHLVLAAVMEMIHTATLVHDDVLDDAEVRRHQDTVNSLWGNQSSVLLGDFLFTHSFYLASTLETTFACREIGRATNIVCEGELRQVHSRGNFGLTEAEYLAIIEAKTAELCACCCRLGAHYARASADDEEALAQYGRALGIAFQITDDLLDLTGDESAVGKSLGTDLDQLKLTLPLIRLLERADPRSRDAMIESLRNSNGNRRELLEPWLSASDGLHYAAERAAGYAAQAREQLNGLAETPAGSVLSELTRFVVARRH
ncbi:MAG: polyprenyl synthetase family protein [Planctomycetes bacterium]|nr:polyprenyl synthetase family protein [Planctomycetota bacterium]